MPYLTTQLHHSLVVHRSLLRKNPGSTSVVLSQTTVSHNFRPASTASSTLLLCTGHTGRTGHGEMKICFRSLTQTLLLWGVSYKALETTNRNESLENKKHNQDLCGRHRPRSVDKPTHQHRWHISVRSVTQSRSRTTRLTSWPQNHKRLMITNQKYLYLHKLLSLRINQTYRETILLAAASLLL